MSLCLVHNLLMPCFECDANAAKSLPERAFCTCMCHTNPEVTHIAACCYQPVAAERDLVKQVTEARRRYDALSPVNKALADSEQRRAYVKGQAGRDPGDVLAAEVVRLRADVAKWQREAAINAAGHMAEFQRAEKLALELYHLKKGT